MYCEIFRCHDSCGSRGGQGGHPLFRCRIVWRRWHQHGEFGRNPCIFKVQIMVRLNSSTHDIITQIIPSYQIRSDVQIRWADQQIKRVTWPLASMLWSTIRSTLSTLRIWRTHPIQKRLHLHPFLFQADMYVLNTGQVLWGGDEWGEQVRPVSSCQSRGRCCHRSCHVSNFFCLSLALS